MFETGYDRKVCFVVTTKLLKSMIFTTVLHNEEAKSLRRVTTLIFFIRRTRKFRLKPGHRERDVCLMDNLATLPDVKLETQRLTRTVVFGILRNISVIIFVPKAWMITFKLSRLKYRDTSAFL